MDKTSQRLLSAGLLPPTGWVFGQNGSQTDTAQFDVQLPASSTAGDLLIVRLSSADIIPSLAGFTAISPVIYSYYTAGINFQIHGDAQLFYKKLTASGAQTFTVPASSSGITAEWRLSKHTEGFNTIGVTTLLSSGVGGPNSNQTISGTATFGNSSAADIFIASGGTMEPIFNPALAGYTLINLGGYGYINIPESAGNTTFSFDVSYQQYAGTYCGYWVGYLTKTS